MVSLVSPSPAVDPPDPPSLPSPLEPHAARRVGPKAAAPAARALRERNLRRDWRRIISMAAASWGSVGCAGMAGAPWRAELGRSGGGDGFGGDGGSGLDGGCLVGAAGEQDRGLVGP